jgi:hypothetical protein
MVSIPGNYGGYFCYRKCIDARAYAWRMVNWVLGGMSRKYHETRP